jgi:hypothetical protein
MTLAGEHLMTIAIVIRAITQLTQCNSGYGRPT